MPPGLPWITPAEAEQQSGIPRRTIIYHINTGKLRATKLPGRTGTWMIPRKHFTRYLNRKATA